MSGSERYAHMRYEKKKGPQDRHLWHTGNALVVPDSGKPGWNWSIVDIAYWKVNCDIVALLDVSPARVTWLLLNCQCGNDTERLWRNAICYNNILYMVCEEVSNHCTIIRFQVYRWLDYSLEESSRQESLQPKVGVNSCLVALIYTCAKGSALQCYLLSWLLVFAV